MITNIEYEESLRNEDNVKIMSSACDHFRTQLDPAVIENCQLHGLYRCLQTHDDTLGNKFTSSLYYHVVKQCMQAVQEHKRFIAGCGLTIDPVDHHDELNGLLVEDCLSLLDERDADIVRDRYLYGMTYAELATKYRCSDNGARFIIERSLDFLRSELCGV